MQVKTYFRTRKKYCIIVYIFLLLFFIFSLRGVSGCLLVYADSGEEKRIDETLNENIQDLMNALDLQELEAYLQSLDLEEKENLKERLVQYINGEVFDYQSIANTLKSLLLDKIISILPAFACIAAITLLSGLISTLRIGSTAHTSADMIFLITYAAALIPLISVITECFLQSMQSVEQMKTQMQIVFPIMLTLISASGGTVSVAVCKPAVAFFTNTIVTAISSIVFPLSVAIIAFSMASNLTKELKINKFTAFFKSINKWIIGLSISVFGIFITLQGLTAATHDGIVRRAAKYAIGSGVPIVGGFLSGGFDLAVAGSVLIKNSLGSLSIFLMISVLFEPLILLISVNLLLRWTAAITQPFGESRISDFLGETADNLNYCSAGLLFVAFMYFLSVVILVTATEALF